MSPSNIIIVKGEERDYDLAFPTEFAEQAAYIYLRWNGKGLQDQRYSKNKSIFRWLLLREKRPETAYKVC